MDKFLTINYTPFPSITKSVLTELQTPDPEDFFPSIPVINPPLKQHLKAIEIEFDAAPNCILCDETITTGQRVTVLKCRHLFHNNCIADWTNNYNCFCPICRYGKED